MRVLTHDNIKRKLIKFCHKNICSCLQALKYYGRIKFGVLGFRCIFHDLFVKWRSISVYLVTKKSDKLLGDLKKFDVRVITGFLRLLTDLINSILSILLYFIYTF